MHVNAYLLLIVVVLLYCIVASLLSTIVVSVVAVATSQLLYYNCCCCCCCCCVELFQRATLWENNKYNEDIALLVLQFDNSLEVQSPFQALSMQLHATLQLFCKRCGRIIFVVTINVASCRITVIEATPITAPQSWVYIREKREEVQLNELYLLLITK